MLEQSIQLVLSCVALHGAPVSGAGAIVSQLTGGTKLRGSLVFIVISFFVIMSSLEDMACRAAKGITGGVIDKGFLRENPFLAT